MSDPRIDSYQWARGREAMLRWGPERGPKVVVALPLFEEANRCRALAATMCGALATRGIGSLLPDLPGQGESLVPLQDCSILDIADGLDGAIKADWEAGTPVYGVAIRSGALLDKLALLNGRWHFAPQRGPDLLRELKRIKQATTGHRLADGDLWIHDPDLPEDAPVEIAGNLVSPGLLTAFGIYEPWTAADGGPVRTVRLLSDPAPADHRVEGAPLWRRAEPDNNLALALVLADDIAEWIARCAA